jgi:glycolate oxidase iron-sulfur subunit
MHEMLPRLAKPYSPHLEVFPAEGPRKARVGFVLGCVADAIYPQTNWSTIRVLQRNGCEVVVPKSQSCCGALSYHMGEEEPAVAFARRNLEAFGFLDGSARPPLDAVIVNAAGCGAMLKDYGHLLHRTAWAEAGERFASLVRDVSEFLAALGWVRPEHPLPIKATYHDACHLCHAQQIRQPPRQVLASIPGMELVPLTESEVCCGAAGSYNLSQPEMARRLGERKAEHILATGTQAVFTANPGCLLQIARHLRAKAPSMWIAHPIDALWASYSGEMPPEFVASTGSTASDDNQPQQR